ncbi:MAG: hypothetical protein ACLROK_11735 [Clostridium sp.]
MEFKEQQWMTKANCVAQNATATAGQILNMSNDIGKQNILLMDQVLKYSRENAEFKRQEEILKKLEFTALTLNKANGEMLLENEVVFTGIVNVLCVIIKDRKEIFVCEVISSTGYRRILEVENDLLFSNKILRVLQHHGLNVSQTFVEIFSLNLAVKVVSKYIRNNGESVSHYPYFAGYDCVWKYQFCNEKDALAIEKEKIRTPFFNRVLIEGKCSGEEMFEVWQAFSDVPDECIRYSLLFLLHEQFMRKFLPRKRSFVVVMNDCEASRVIGENLVPWKNKKFLHTFRKRDFIKAIESANDETLVISLDQSSPYDKKCAETHLLNRQKSNVNLLVIGDGLINKRELFDQQIILADNVRIGKIPLQYYFEFIKWLESQSKIDNYLELDGNSSEFREYICQVVNAMAGFWKSKGCKLTPFQGCEMVEKIEKFFDRSNPIQKININEEFANCLKKSNFEIEEFDFFGNKVEDCVIYCDDEYLYLSNDSVKELIDDFSIKLSKKIILQQLFENGLLIREHRGENSYYNTVKVDGKRVVKLKRSGLLSVEEEIFWRDAK